MSVAKSLLAGSVTRVTQTVVTMLVAFFMMPFLVGEIGDHWYGVWTVIGSLAAAYHLFDMGMAGAVTRYVSYALGREDVDEANTVINTSVAIYLLISLALMLVSLVVAYLAQYFLSGSEAEIGTVRTVILIVGVSVALEFPFNALAGVASAKLRFHQVALARIVTTLIGAGFIWYVVKQGHGIIGIAVVTFCAARLSNVLYFLICRAAFPELAFGRRYFSRHKLRELFGYSAWAFLIAIAYQMRNNVDNFVIAGALSAATVTHYFVGARLVEFLAIMLSQATNMFIPIFTKYHSQDNRKELHEKLLFVTRMNFFIALICAGSLILLGEAFIIEWMGEDYRDAYPVLVILLVGRMIGFSNNPLNSALYATNKHSIIAKLDVIEVALNLTLSLILVQYFGMIGVAFGTLIPLLLLRIVFLPMYGCRAIGMKMSDYYSVFLRPTLVLVPLIVLYQFGLNAAFSGDSIISILLVGAIGASLIALCGVRASFSRSERELFGTLIPGRMLKKIVV